MADQSLLDAIDKAIEALENVRRQLERARDEETMTPPIPVTAQPPVFQTETANAPLPIDLSVPQRTRLMRTAADIASTVCSQWTFRDEPGNIVDASLLRHSSEEQDSIGTVDPDDLTSYYIVSPDGAIGLTENDGENIDWLFLPLGSSAASLPRTFRKGEPWPAAQHQENAVPSQPSSIPQPAPAPQPAPIPQTPPAPQNVPVSQPAPAQAAPSGNVCPGCGMPVDPGSRFCMSCGTPLSNAPAAAPAPPKGAFCMNCGAPLNPGDKFCMKCGTKV